MPDSVYSALVERVKSRPGTPRGAVVVLNLLQMLGPTPAAQVKRLANVSDRTMERAEYDLLEVGALHVFTDIDPGTRKRRKMYTLQIPAELAVAS